MVRRWSRRRGHGGHTRRRKKTEVRLPHVEVSRSVRELHRDAFEDENIADDRGDGAGEGIVTPGARGGKGIGRT